MPLQPSSNTIQPSIPSYTIGSEESRLSQAAPPPSSESPSVVETSAVGTLAEANRDGVVAKGRAWHLPEVPKYAIAQSRTTPGQMKALEWLSVNGRRRFEAQEAQLLSLWGVTPEHSGTCLLVPLVWSNLDPAHIATTFSFEVYSRLDSTRLVCPFT